MDQTASAGMLPTIRLGQYEVTRLIIGGNPFKGYSHFRQELDREMRDYHTQERIVQTLLAADAAGINTMQSRGDVQIMNAVRAYRRAGGAMQWICQTASEWPDVMENIRAIARLEPIAIYHHGTNTDQHFKAGTMDVVRRRIDLIKDLGLLAGVASHMPECLEWIAEHNWPVDFYMCCFYNLSREHHESQIVSGRFVNEDHLFNEEDPPRMIRFIQQADKPCLAFKVLAAGRKCASQEQVREAFRYAFSNIRPTDAIIVGMWTKYLDQPRIDAEHARAVLSELAAAG